MFGNSLFIRRGTTRALIGGLLFLFAGCTTVPPAQVASFGEGVNKAKTQIDTAFTGVNEVITEDQIAWTIKQNDLTEDEVAPVLPAADIAKWDNAFAEIGQYVTNLNLLLSPDTSDQFGQASQGLADALNKLDPNALPSAGVSAAFAELGRLVIEAKAQSDALSAARIADPGIQ